MTLVQYYLRSKLPITGGREIVEADAPADMSDLWGQRGGNMKKKTVADCLY